MRRVSTIRRVIVIATLLLLGASACSGCQEEFLDRIEDPLRADPQRAGKVGTLRALEVVQQAHGVTLEVARQARGPCQIQWRPDEPFDVAFSLSLEVEEGRWTRSWREEGRFRQDDAGRWEISSVATFSEGGALPRRRETYVFRDDDGFYELLGPEAIAHYPEDEGAVARWWFREFTGRFASLVELLDVSGWKEREPGVWVPGAEIYRCEPSSAGEGATFRPLFAVRTEAGREEILREEGDDGSCREIRARRQLRSGGALRITLRECLREAPEGLRRDDFRRVVEVERDRERAAVFRLYDQWVEAGLIDADETSKE